MIGRPGFVSALSAFWVIACVAVLSSPGPAAPVPLPASAPTLAPIDDDASPEPSPSPGATPKLLGRVSVSAFCSSFVEHFNVAARTMVSNDGRLDDAVAAVRGYEDDFSRMDGAFSAWDHRLRLMAALKELLVTIPKTQAAVDALRAQVLQTDDADRRSALAESAAQLQSSVDHQRVVVYEMQDLMSLMLDMHGSDDTIGHAVGGTLGPGEKVIADALDAPVPHPGDALPGKVAPPARGPSAIELVLRVPRDRRLIADAESNAAAAALRVITKCVQEASPAPPTPR